MTVRPPDPTNGPSPATMPDDLERDRALGAALERDVGADAGGRPRAASRSVTSAPNASGPARRLPATSGRSADLGLGGRVDAEDRDRLRQDVRIVERPDSRYVRRSSTGAATDDPGRLVDRGHALRRAGPVAERGDPQVGPPDEVADGPVDRRLDPGVGRERGEQDADAEGDPDDRQQRPAAAGGEAPARRATSGRPRARGPARRGG